MLLVVNLQLLLVYTSRSVEWPHIGSIPDIPNLLTVNGPFLPVDGMLTSLGFLDIGLIYWKDEVEDEEWITAEIEIPRKNVGWAVIPCA